MKTGTVFIVDGKFTDHYAIGEIDCTHVYLKRYSGEVPSEEEVEGGHVYHVAQLKGMAEGFYEAVWEWLRGKRELRNVGFASAEFKEV